MDRLITIPIQGDSVDKGGTLVPFDVLIKSYKEKVGKPCVAEMEGNPSVVLNLTLKEIKEFPDREKYAEIILECTMAAIQTN